MMLLSFAWRNIWRHPRRTLLTIFAAAFTSTILVFFVSLQLSSYATMVDVATSTYHGHMQIQPKGYLDDPSLRKVIEDPEPVREKILRLNDVQALSMRAEGFALASSEDRTFGIQVVGVEPDRERETSTVPKNVREGGYLQKKDSYDAVIGTSLAKNLQVALGDEVTILGQGADGSLAASVVTVVGIFESGTREVDKGMIHIPLGAFQEIFSLGTATQSFVLKLSELDRDRAVQQQLQGTLDEHGLVALRWDELLPGLKEAIRLDMITGWFFYFGLVLVVVLSVLNTFLMSVLERTREFGVLLALGTRPLQLGGLVFLEATMLSCIGLIAGILCGIAIVLYFGTYGFLVPGSEEAMKIWNINTAIYTRVSVTSLLLGPSMILLTSYLALLYPLSLLWTLKPVEAMTRHA